MSYPKNHGKPWTPAEKEAIKNWWNWATTKMLLNEQDAIRAIAKEFSRTPYSIQCKLKDVGCLGHFDHKGRRTAGEPEQWLTYGGSYDEKIRSGGWEAKEDSEYSGISCLPDHMVVQYAGTTDKEKEMSKVYEEQVLVFGVNVAKAGEDQLLGLLTDINSKSEALTDINPGNTEYFEKVFCELDKAEKAVLAQLDERFS